VRRTLRTIDENAKMNKVSTLGPRRGGGHRIGCIVRVAPPRIVFGYAGSSRTGPAIALPRRLR